MPPLRTDSSRQRATAIRLRRTPELVPGSARPARPPAWSVICPEGTVFVDVTATGVRASRRWVRRLPAGIPVALVDDRAFSRPRLRQLARRAGLTVERELLVLPRCADPVVVLDDAPAPVRHFWTTLAAVPPGVTRGALTASLAVRVARLLPWSVTGAIAPGRVLLGRRR